jgi:hypothetical protein
MDTSTSTRRAPLVTIAALLALAIAALLAPAANARVGDFAFETSSASLSGEAAGGHADFVTRWSFNTDPTVREGGQRRPWASMRNLVTELPPGLLGNPSAFPTCDMVTFAGQANFGTGPFCPTDSQVGMIAPSLFGFFSVGEYNTPLFNLDPPANNPHVVARLGFIAVITAEYIDITLDPKREDALTATLVNAPNLTPIPGSINTLWGVPTEAVHDSERFNTFEAILCGGLCGAPVPSGLPPTPFMRNPTSCGPAEAGYGALSYDQPGGLNYAYAPLADIAECESVPFEPTMSLAPTTNSAGASSGIDVELHVPQEGLTEPEGLGSADLKQAVVTLPKGVALNASAADGLTGCSEAQIGVDRAERQVVDVGGRGAPVRFSYAGAQTAELPSFADAGEVQTALAALPGIGTGNVSVSGRSGGSWTVDFTGTLAGEDVPAIAGTHSELQHLAVEAEGGTYTLSFQGEETGPISYDADAGEVQAALEGLPSMGAGAVEVSGGPTPAAIASDVHQGFDIAFVGPLAQTDVAPITATNSLSGGETIAEVTTSTQGGSAVVTHTVKQGGSLGFDDEAARCPESSKIASGEISTPVLAGPLKANVYLASQSQNPFGSLFAGYLVASGRGVMIKVPAKIEIDPVTGQIKTVFGNNPQQPFEDLELHFKGGNRGVITTPNQCGIYASEYELIPWSGNAPVTGKSQFTINQGCGSKAFSPGFQAGSETALAGSFTTFATQVTNDAGAPPLRRISVNLPEGLAAKLAGVATCPDSALAAIPTAPGTAASQLASPACPASSQIGTVEAGAGSGAPYYEKTGRVYLAGPYSGAPLSLAVIAPVVAGPFDLGNVLDRVPVTLDRRTARAYASSDPIPTMLAGIPLELRDVRVLLDRQGFALNPTSCEAKASEGQIDGEGGASASVSDRFQVGECAALAFKPKMSLRLKGGTKRGDHPALTAVLKPRPGDANIGALTLALPRSEFLDQSHIGTVCTRVQYAADQCPAASVYGKVTATTPLLDSPLTGNVYLRSSEHKLPDLVTDLRGPSSQPIHLEASGRIDSVNGGIRTSFEFVPDAPITRVVVQMQGGRKGLLQNSRNICAQTFKAAVSFAAHNGRSLQASPALNARCKASAAGKRHGKSHGG